jgi:hypothetical protein
VTVPEDATVVDGTGRFLIPGLSDMHAHVYGEPELLLYVAYGVTRIRNMWGDHTALAMRARSDSGVIVAPRILTAGRLVDGSPPVWGETSASIADPAAARALIDEERRAGFDLLKIYNSLSAETFDAIAEHSRATGHPFGGHVPRSVSLEHAFRSGMQTIEHNRGWAEATQVRRVSGPDEGREILQRIARGEVGWDALYDLDRTRELARLAAESGVWHVPTLSWFDGVYTSRRQVAERMGRPGIEYMSPRITGYWDPTGNPGLARLSDETLESFQKLQEIELIRTKALHDAGAPLLMGTDAPNPFVATGAAVHGELALLVEAGLTPFEALRTATAAVGEFIGDSTVGTITRGAPADLLLLGGNPLEDIGATREIEGVVLRGGWLPRDSLDGLLARAAASYRPPDAWFDDLEDGAVLYRLWYDSAEVGLERVIRRAGSDTSVVEGRRSSLHVSGGLVREAARLERATDGTVLRLTFSQETSAGYAEVQAVREGDRLSLSGRTASGQAIRRTVVLEAGARITCPLAVCLGPVIDGLSTLPVGESSALDVLALSAATGSRGHPSGDPRFAHEAWEVIRGEDSASVRRFDILAERAGTRWPLTLRVDSSGLASLSRTDWPRGFTLRRF